VELVAQRPDLMDVGNVQCRILDPVQNDVHRSPSAEEEGVAEEQRHREFPFESGADLAKRARFLKIVVMKGTDKIP
jgi:hypothetical protein